LKIQVGIVHLVGANFGQSARQMALVETKRRQEQLAGNINALLGGRALGRGRGGA
jgi:hypothetical protein